MMPKPIDEPAENMDISVIDLDQIDDDKDDDVVEVINLVTPEKVMHHKKKMIERYLTDKEADADTLSDLSGFAQDFGVSESFIMEELNRFENDNSNAGTMMDELVAMLEE